MSSSSPRRASTDATPCPRLDILTPAAFSADGRHHSRILRAPPPSSHCSPQPPSIGDTILAPTTLSLDGRHHSWICAAAPAILACSRGPALLRCVSTRACRVAPGAVVKPVPALPGATCGKVPAGHVPMVVGAEGEDTQRFIVPVELLGRPPIVELLRRAAQEYTYMRRGSLRIPFPLVAFRLLLSALAGTAAAAGPDGGLTFACFSMVV
uniref:Auxin-responsive protein SAUR71 n=3 Tax=Zea mays TaxID=4577 RepID=A0A804QS24_MAIZE